MYAYTYKEEEGNDWPSQRHTHLYVYRQYAYIHTYVYAYIHTYVYAYIHTHVHTIYILLHTCNTLRIYIHVIYTTNLLTLRTYIHHELIRTCNIHYVLTYVRGSTLHSEYKRKCKKSGMVSRSLSLSHTHTHTRSLPAAPTTTPIRLNALCVRGGGGGGFFFGIIRKLAGGI
jgi:hypothetical protein